MTEPFQLLDASLVGLVWPFLPFVALVVLRVVGVGRLQKRDAIGSPRESVDRDLGRPEPTEVWSSAGLHAYRSLYPERSQTRGSWILRNALFPLLVIMVLVALASASFRRPSDLGGIAVFVTVVGVLLALAAWFGRQECREIRLGDDGTCELETGRRVIRLHVNQIRSVRYRRDSEGGESYTIRFEGGKVLVGEETAGFHDFLTRLKMLNPAVDLSTFPPGDWPGLATPAEAHAAAQHGVGYVLFPVGVVILLIWLATQTLR